jgi:PAS domain S-box-containing protein
MDMKKIIDFITIAALFVNALLFIPQSIKIFKEKAANGVSLFTFTGFLLIQLTIVLYCITIKNYLLAVGYMLSMATCGSVIIMAFVYRKTASSLNENDIGFKEIFEQLPGHIYWKDRNCLFIGSNANNLRDFGFKSLSDYKGKNDYDCFPKAQADHIRMLDEEVMRTGKLKIAEELCTIHNGETALYLSHKMPLKNKHGKIVGLIGTSVDITNAKQETSNRLEMLENIIAVMPGNVYWINKDGVYLGCNNNEAKAIGCASRKEVVGKRNVDIPAIKMPTLLNKVNKKVIETGNGISLEETAILPDGTQATFLSNKVPLKDNNGEVTGMVGISIDITDRKDLQKKLQEAQLKEKLQEEKLLAMRSLAASIAHELRSPLLSIYSVSTLGDVLPDLVTAYEMGKAAGLDLPFMRQSQLESIKNSLGILEREANYANAIINMSLENIKELEISRKNFKRQSMATCINSALSRYPFSSETEKNLILNKNENDFIFLGDELQVCQVLSNLLKNALYYVGKAGKGQIKIWTDGDDKFNRLHFKDTGTGIEKEILPKIFDHFFSKTENGTGIGLAYCKMVMQNMDGDIVCESVHGDYAEFILTFPKIEG